MIVGVVTLQTPQSWGSWLSNTFPITLFCFQPTNFWTAETFQDQSLASAAVAYQYGGSFMGAKWVKCIAGHSQTCILKLNFPSHSWCFVFYPQDFRIAETFQDQPLAGAAFDGLPIWRKFYGGQVGEMHCWSIQTCILKLNFPTRRSKYFWA